MDQELAELEASGGTRSVHFIIAICYLLGGRIGVAVCLTLTGIIFATLAFRAFRETQKIKARKSAMTDSLRVAPVVPTGAKSADGSIRDGDR